MNRRNAAAATVINRPMNLSEWGMLLGLSVLWGGSFFFTGVAIKELPPLTLVALRVGLAAFVLHVLILAIGLRMPRDARVWGAFLAMGLLNNAVPFALIVWGQSHIASGLAAILNATTPLFGVLSAHAFISDERMTASRLAGVVVGLAGVVVMIGPEALGAFRTEVVAQLAVLSAALSYALAGVYGRRFKALGIPPMLTATGQVTASAAMLLPIACIVERPWELAIPSPSAWAAVLAIAVLSTALAYVVYFRILASAGATNLLLVTFLIPVTAILLGSAFLGERLNPKHFAGMALIGAGLAAIDGRILMGRHRRKLHAASDEPVSGPELRQGSDI